MSAFNLITEPWIPVLRINGRFERIGIRTALAEAGRIRQIAASNPMDNVALLRFLLAVLLWCRPGLSQEDRRRLDDAEGVPPEWLARLEEHKAAFNLLGEGKRFLQAPAEAANERPVADLFHELPGATNKAHFRHVRDNQHGACPVCVSIGLVRLPVAITGKGAGKRPGINGDPPMYFMPVGGALLDTLVLNWPLAHVPGDQPCWFGGEQPAQEQIGVMEGFTWVSRQFRIADDGLRRGTCMVCGADTKHLVVGLKELNKPNGRDGLSRCGAARWRDPHIIYNDKDKPWQAEDAEKNLPESSGQWREWLAGLLAGGADGLQCPTAVAAVADRFNGRVSVHVAGFAMQSSDKSVESCNCCLKIDRGDGEGSANLESLGEVVSQLLDPKASLKGKKLATMKARHPLRVIRSIERPLSDSTRAALADRLPALEAAMFESLRSPNGGVVDPLGCTSAPKGWQPVLKAVADAITPGSPLRRREATARARSALDDAIRKATAPPEPFAKGDKPKRTRKKKGDGA
ncbi:MAG TPA: type I-E CRISPR-associated protein Cse1/CasA [Phycisphaerales bacterium]|nr:type I-E CRISPR-associated protein Cse1/CasA [Phycisphaerales bacterium]